MPELAYGLLFFLHGGQIQMPELAYGLLALLHGGRIHMVGEAQSWGSDYFGGKVVPGAAAQPIEIQGEASCWGGYLGGDYVTGAAL